MMGNFDNALKRVLANEGGFTNDPKDPGGMTNLGVTKKNWEDWSRRAVTEQEMRSLGDAVVAPFYRARYWDAIKADNLPTGIDYLVFDFAVNAGVSRASKFLQNVVKVKEDGIIGLMTLAAVRAMNPDDLVKQYSDLKTEYYQSLNTFDHFGEGWLARVAQVQNDALTMTS